MIKAFLAASPSMYEGEDIEVRYSLFEDGIQVKTESIYLEYVKPAIVGQVAFLTLLEKLAQYKKSEIAIVMNDPALYEILRGTSTTKKGEIIKMSNTIRKQLGKFENLSFSDVGKNKANLLEWKTILKG